MTIETTKTYQYEITITGDGGEYSYISMSPEQLAFWRGKGEDALAEHLVHGFGEDGTPPEFELGFYNDIGDCASGIDVTEDVELVVRDENGQICYERILSGEDLDDILQIYRKISEPLMGAFFCTYEKAEQSCILQLSEPFDPSKLRLRATLTPQDELINGFFYDGAKVEEIYYEEKVLNTIYAHFIA